MIEWPLLIYILFGLTPGIYNTSLSLVLFIIVIISFLKYKASMRGLLLNKYNMLIYVWIIYNFLLKIIGYSSASIGNYFNIIIFYFCIIFYRVIKKTYKIDSVYRIVKFCERIIIINLLTNIYYVIKNPGIVEQLNFNPHLREKYINLGNTNFSFLIVIFCLTSYYKFLINRSVKDLLLIGLGILYIYNSSKTTALILLLIFLLKMSINYYQKKIPKVTFVLSYLLVIMIMLKNKILTHLVSLIDNEYIKVRLESLVDINIDSVYLERFNLGIMSIKTFFKNPLVGVGYSKIDILGNLEKLKEIGIGHHSELLDSFGRFGVVGIIIISLIFINYYNEIYDRRYKVLINNIFQVFILYSILNNSFYLSSGILFFIYIPSLIMLLRYSFEISKNKGEFNAKRKIKKKYICQ